MSTRQHYLDEIKLKLDKWNMDIDDMEEGAKRVGSNMRAVHNKNLATLKKNRDEAAKKFEAIQHTTDSEWDEAQENKSVFSC